MSVTGAVLDSWARADSAVARRIVEQSENNLRAYRVNPTLIVEHANIERATAQGGYGRRQIYELVQNGADALLGTPGGKIHVVLTEHALYCANEGPAIDEDGVTSLLSSHISLKRGVEIGRFGLGFKSVLGVTRCPEFYSRAASFIFDADWSERQVRQVHPSAGRYPVLRLAKLVDPVEAAAGDKTLAELMSWATTIVKLPRDPAESPWLSEDLRNFPREFLLFSSHVGELCLIDKVTGLRRELYVKRDHGRLRLIEGDRMSSWRVFSRTHVPSAAARKDAGELADRDSLPLIWAVPLEGRIGRGRFWAFFPTEYYTTLSGILNAPWKTNEDRQNLLTGTFNEELLEAGAALVVDSLPELIERSDPGRYLDLIPARGREAPNPSDEYLTEAVYRLAQDRPSIPDQLGRLQPPALMQLHPEGATREALQLWSESPDRPLDWAHPSVETRERRPRVERLLAGAGRPPASWSTWLGQLVTEHSAQGSIIALRIAGELYEHLTGDQKRDLARSEIVLTDQNQLIPLTGASAFLPGEYESSLELTFVHPEVASDELARAALERWGFTEADPRQELEALLQTYPYSSYGPYAWNERRWAVFWSLCRRAGTASIDLIKESRAKNEVHAMTLAGEFRPIHSLLLPGPIVPEDGHRDIEATIDVNYHQHDLELLSALGAQSSPSVGYDCEHEPWFRRYHAAAVHEFVRSLPSGHRQPQSHYLIFRRSLTIGPLEVFRYLSEEGRARFTEALFQTDQDLDPWVLVHTTGKDVYPTLQVLPPHVWVTRHEGRLRTSLGVRTIERSVAPALHEWHKLLPVAHCPDAWSSALGLPASLAELPKRLWDEALHRTETLDDDVELGRFYALAAQYVGEPSGVRCRIGMVHQTQPPSSVTVVSARREFDALISQAIPCLLVSSRNDAETLTKNWGLRPAETAVKTEIYAVPSGPEVPLVDEFPGLRWALSDSDSKLLLLRCSVLRLETLTDGGKTSDERTLHIADGRIYWAGSTDAELLATLKDELAFELSGIDIEQILQEKAERARRDQIVKVREQPTIQLRLIAAVGAANLRRRLPTSLLDSVRAIHGALDENLLAELALAVYGVDTLRAFKSELADNGLEPPQQWAGSPSARLFVRDLGFPPEFAGFEQAKRDPLEEVDGPPLLPPLHEFQAVMAARMRALLGTKENNRAILALPTGAGKTRIAVEALIDEMREGRIRGPILWVAQNDELCEQAVQSWRYVWRALGARESLSISRLWASNEAVQLDTPFHVVVATIDKLQVCFEKPAYTWLAAASCVIVDEAHESTGPSYTRLLEWLGLDRRRRGVPLVGLTATPYRGVSESETMALVRRYGEQRLDHGVLGDDAYATLQQMGVLARVKHQVLDGSSVELTQDELRQLQRTRLVPASVEIRLGADPQRNQMLLKSILGLSPDWTALLFATSVDHAQTMAALLSLNGVAAAAISANTEPGARRHYVEQFRRGEIRVLTNYAVLTQGFDAPAVRAIYVARPTYSPNLYQQMIGRGLRGPKNLGTEECLIVNVRDNVRQYGEELAFRMFEHLWTPYENAA
jgi:superfamily II DNA or RNA helicase